MAQRRRNPYREQFYEWMFSEISPAFSPWASMEWDEGTEEYLITDREDEDKSYRLGYPLIAKGWQALVKLDRAGKWQHCLGAGMTVSQSEYSLANHGEDNNADYDACVIDAVVQLALLGEVRYG